MPTRTEVAIATQENRRLAYLGGFFAGGLALSALYATTGIGVGCPFRLVTGWDCPFCGGTRMGAALLHGDLALAWAYNPLALAGLVALAAVGLVWLVDRVGGPQLRPSPALADRLRRVHPTRWLVVGLVIGVLYTLARNLT